MGNWRVVGMFNNLWKWTTKTFSKMQIWRRRCKHWLLQKYNKTAERSTLSNEAVREVDCRSLETSKNCWSTAHISEKKQNVLILFCCFSALRLAVSILWLSVALCASLLTLMTLFKKLTVILWQSHLKLGHAIWLLVRTKLKARWLILCLDDGLVAVGDRLSCSL